MPTGTDAPDSTASPADAAALPTAAQALALLAARRTVLPKRLCAPGPDAAQAAHILAAAAHAPDHGRLRPWRFIQVPDTARPALAQAFADALLWRDAQATPEQVARAREKAQHAPWLLLAVVRLREEDEQEEVQEEGQGGSAPSAVPAHERILSAGCALQNMLLAAQALGLGAALTSGQSLQTPPLRRLFGLGAHEQALCFLSVGHIASQKPARPRPAMQDYVSSLQTELP